MEQGQYVWILNVGRTGSTWLSSTMGQHPEVLDACECNWFSHRPEKDERGYYPLHCFMDSWRMQSILTPLPLRHLTEGQVHEVMRQHVLSVCSLALEATGRWVMVDKSPPHTNTPESMRLAHAVLPEATRIHLVRDFGSVWLSYVHRFPDYWVVKEGPREFTRIILRAYRTMDALFPEPPWTIRFEDLETGEFDWDELWRHIGVQEGHDFETPPVKHPRPRNAEEEDGLRLVREELAELSSRWY